MPGSDLPPVYYLDESGAGSALMGGTPSSVGGGGFASGEVSIGDIENFELMDLILMAVVYSFIIAFILSAIFIFVGGMSFILSGGNDEKIKQGINTIRYSLIGLIIVILSFTFVVLIGKMFGFNFMEYISLGKIRDLVNQVVSSGGSEPATFNVR